MYEESKQLLRFAAPEFHDQELAGAIVAIVSSSEFVNDAIVQVLASSSFDQRWILFALFVAWAEVEAIKQTEMPEECSTKLTRRRHHRFHKHAPFHRLQMRRCSLVLTLLRQNDSVEPPL
jgi:hypothetical protein